MAKVNVPSNILDRILRLERDLADVRKKVGLSSATISRGDLTVQDGGSFRLLHPNGTPIAKIGNLGVVGDEEVWGVAFGRADGSDAITVYTTESGAFTFAAFKDQTGDIIVSDDGVTRHGMATPYLAWPIAPGSSSDNVGAVWPRTKSSSFDDLFNGTVPATHPRIGIDVSLAVDTSVTGQGRVLINGTQVGDTFAHNTYTSLTEAIPGWGDTVGYLDPIEIKVQGRKTNSASGNLYGMVYRLHGVQS